MVAVQIVYAVKISKNPDTSQPTPRHLCHTWCIHLSVKTPFILKKKANLIWPITIISGAGHTRETHRMASHPRSSKQKKQTRKKRKMKISGASSLPSGLIMVTFMLIVPRIVLRVEDYTDRETGCEFPSKRGYHSICLLSKEGNSSQVPLRRIAE